MEARLERTLSSSSVSHNLEEALWLSLFLNRALRRSPFYSLFVFGGDDGEEAEGLQAPAWLGDHKKLERGGGVIKGWFGRVHEITALGNRTG